MKKEYKKMVELNKEYEFGKNQYEAKEFEDLENDIPGSIPIQEDKEIKPKKSKKKFFVGLGLGALALLAGGIIVSLTKDDILLNLGSVSSTEKNDQEEMPDQLDELTQTEKTEKTEIE